MEIFLWGILNQIPHKKSRAIPWRLEIFIFILPQY